MIGADALLATLERKGVKEIFAYPGGAVLPIYDRMPNYDIRRILVRHEQAAAFAAQGYSRATGGVGVCLATSGPGATNLVTGIADAKLDNIPMVAITGNVFTHLIGTDAFQEVDIVGICEPIVKHSYFVTDANEIPRVLEEAFYVAKSGRPGPVLIDITKTAQSDSLDPAIVKSILSGEPVEIDLPGYLGDPEPDLSEANTVVDIIAEAERPVVIYGHGVNLSGAEAELQEFLDITGIPHVWTLHGIGSADETGELALGMLGMHGTGTANYAVHHADVIVGIGIRFDDRITGLLKEFQSNNKIVHFDIDRAEFDKNVDLDGRILGQLRETLPVINQKLKNSELELGSKIGEWCGLLRGKKKEWKLDPNKPKVLTEIAVINELYKIIDQDDIVTVDVGQHEMWAAQRFFPKKSRKFLASGGAGTMGFSFPAAIGAAFSGNDVWSISGDGGFQMNIQEFATCVQDKIPVKIMVLNNSFLGMVRQWQELFYDNNYVDTPLVNPDFAAVAAAYGIPSFTVTNLKDTTEVLQKMKAYNDGPIFCEFKVEKEENVFPMVPAGESLGNTKLNKDTTIED